MTREIIPSRMKPHPSDIVTRSALILLAMTTLVSLLCIEALAAGQSTCITCHSDAQKLKLLVKPPDIHGEAEG